MSSDNIFQYHYCGATNQEARQIRDKYLPWITRPLDELKRLDKLVQTSGKAQGLSVGIAGCLLLCSGLHLTVQMMAGMVLGLLLMLCGIGSMLLAYPVYRLIYTRAREKYAPRILQLSEELSGQARQN